MKMPRLARVAVLAAGFLLSCQQGPPRGHVTQRNVERAIKKAQMLLVEGKFDEAVAAVERAQKNLSKVERIVSRRGSLWRRVKKSGARLKGLRKEIAWGKEEAARTAEEEKKRLEAAAAAYVLKEEAPEPKKEKRDTYVDRDVTASRRFAARKRADEAPAVEEEEKPPEEKSVIPKDIKPEEPVTVVRVETKDKYLLCYVVFYNPDSAAYLASLSVDFLDKTGNVVTFNRKTYRAEGFEPNSSNIYESKGVGVAASELMVGEKKKVGLVGVGDSNSARNVRKVKVTVITTDGRTYTGRGRK